MTNPFKKSKEMFQESELNSAIQVNGKKKKKESLFLKIKEGITYIRLLPVDMGYEPVISYHHEKLGAFSSQGAKVNLRIKCLKAKDPKADCPACDEASRFAKAAARENGGKLPRDFFMFRKDAEPHQYFLAYQYMPGLDGDGVFSDNDIQFVDYKTRKNREQGQYTSDDWDNLVDAISKGMAAGLDPFDPEKGNIIGITIKEVPGVGQNNKKILLHEVKKISVALPADWKQELERMVKPADYAIDMSAEEMKDALELAAQLEDIPYRGLSEEEAKAEADVINEAFFSIPNERIQKVVELAKEYAERQAQRENDQPKSNPFSQPASLSVAPKVAPKADPKPAPEVKAEAPKAETLKVEPPKAEAPKAETSPSTSKAADALARIRARAANKG